MPIYEYECPKCGVMEVSQRITEDPLAKCPQCKRRKVKKLISNTSFQLKGSGWYVTDYGGKKTGDSAAAGDSAGDSTDSSSGDSKAASATGDGKSDSSTKKESPKKESTEKKKDTGKAKAA